MDPNQLKVLESEAQRLLDLRVAELTKVNAGLYQEEVQKIEAFYDDVREQKRYEIREFEKSLSELKRERIKAPFERQREINVEIQKLKDKIDKLEADVSELRKTSRAAEKQRLSDLEGKVVLRTQFKSIAAGIFSVK